MTKRMMMIAAAMFVLGAPTMAISQSDVVQAQNHAAHRWSSDQDRRIGQARFTIKHGPIKKFDMDGMTMVFRAQDPAMLKSVKAGDKVKFDLEKIKGQFTVTKIEKAK